MTILFIGPLPPPVTGQSLACQVLLEGLRRDFRAELINLSKKELAQGVSSRSRVIDVARILWRVWRKRNGVDVIYLTVSESFAGNVKDLFIYLLCFGQLRRMVIHLHGGAGMRRIMLETRLVRIANTFFLRRLGAVVVLGHTHRAIYRAVVPDARIHVVPNFAEDHVFVSPDRMIAKFRHTNPLKVLFLSNLLPGKGHEELLEAFLALDERTKASIQIDMAGAFESERQKAEFLARISGVANVRYHGTVTGERKVALFQQAHVFCLPTYYPYEGQPISILEAYAAGCAVITTDHSGIPDVFRGDENGFHVAPRSVPELRMALERAVAAPAQLGEMAATNRQTAWTRYRTAEYTQRLVQILAAVAGQT